MPGALTGTKGIQIPGPKVSPTAPDAAQFTRIQPFLRSKNYKPDDFYIGQMRMAHNAIDRDDERFSEKLLERFAETAIRKTLLLDHGTYDSKANAVGKFFDAEIEKSPVASFKKLREDDNFAWLADVEGYYELKIVKTQPEVWFLSLWFYIPRAAVDAQTIAKIDTGIFDWASIGFTAERRYTVEGPGGIPLYSEYMTGPHAEMREGSLVYLGAQQGAAVKSADSGQPALFADAQSNPKEKKAMQDFIKKLAKLLGKPLSDESEALDAVQALVHSADSDAKRVKETEDSSAKLTAVTEERDSLRSKFAALEPLLKDTPPDNIAALAAEGKAFRDDLVTRYVQAKVKLGECDAGKPEMVEGLKATAKGFRPEFLKSEVALIEQRVFEKFPDTRQTPGQTRDDKAAGAEAAAGGDDENHFIPEERRKK